MSYCFVLHQELKEEGLRDKKERQTDCKSWADRGSAGVEIRT